MKNIKTVSIHQLQAKASSIIKEVENGKTYKIVRYSQPAAVLISEEEYECLTGECRNCVKELVNELKFEARNPKSEK